MKTRTIFDALKLRAAGGRFTRRGHVLATGAVGLAVLTSAQAASAAITVDAAVSPSGNPHFWSACVGTGTASLTLRSDLQTHYKLGARELGMLRVRGHGVLNDDMGVYKAAGSYDWTKFDTWLSAIVAAGMRPIMELSFMPTTLAASGNNKNPPKDLPTYQKFIQAVVQHCVDKYGAEEVVKWYWEVWNEPNYTGFWTGTMDQYFTMYDAAAAGAVAALPNIMIGGPATTPGSANQVTALLNHVKTSGARITFVSSHAYPGAGGPTANADFGLTDNDARVAAIKSAGYTTANIKSLNTEWSSSYSGQGGGTEANLVSMDNYQQAAFIVKAVKLLADQTTGSTPSLEVFSYWVMSDVFDESSGPSGSYILSQTAAGTLPFGSVFGLTTFQGMRKAAFNGFKMLNYLGPKRLSVSGGTGTKDGVDAFAAMSANGDEVQIAVYNYYNTVNTTGTDDTVTLTVNNLPLTGQMYVSQFMVDNTHSNPYSVWVGQSKPKSPTEANWQAMRSAQHLALLKPVATVAASSTYTATFALPKQAVSLIILGKSRPLTGRDAFVEIEAEDYDGQSGATKEDSGDTSMGQSIAVTAGGYVYYENVDYSDAGADTVQFRLKTAADTTAELHAETQTGTLLGKCTLTSTSNAWATQKCTLTTPATGVSKLYVVFAGAAHLNSLVFSGAGGTPPLGTGGSGAGGGASIGGAGGTPGAGGVSAGGAASRGGAGGVAVVQGGANNGGSAQGGSIAQGGSQSIGGGPAAGGVTVVQGGTNNNGGAAAGGKASSGGSQLASGGSTSGPVGGSGVVSAGGSNNNVSSSGGNSGSVGSPTPAADSGCGCRVANSSGPRGATLIGGLVLAMLGLRRRRAPDGLQAAPQLRGIASSHAGVKS